MSKVKVGETYELKEGGSATVIEYEHSDRVLIRHNWRPDSSGYTSSRISAGFYTEQEAKDVCDHPNSSCKYKPVSELFSLAELNEIESNVQQIKYQIELSEVDND